MRRLDRKRHRASVTRPSVRAWREGDGLKVANIAEHPNAVRLLPTDIVRRGSKQLTVAYTASNAHVRRSRTSRDIPTRCGSFQRISFSVVRNSRLTKTASNGIVRRSRTTRDIPTRCGSFQRISVGGVCERAAHCADQTLTIIVPALHVDRFATAPLEFAGPLPNLHVCVTCRRCNRENVLISSVVKASRA